MTRPKLTIKRKPYTRRDGTKVKRTTFLTTDKGMRGRTPKPQRWYNPSVHTGWRADMNMAERRSRVLDSHGGSALSSARAMLALSNVQKRVNRDVSLTARKDADYFFLLHKQGK